MPVNKNNLQFSKIAAKQSLNHNPEGVSSGEGKRREEDFTASHFCNAGAPVTHFSSKILTLSI